MAWKVKNLEQGQINDASHSSNAPALYYQDVTQERQKAKFYMSFLSSLVEGMMDTVLIVNPKTGLVEYANKAAQRMFDCQLEDLIDHPPDIFYSLETRLKFHEEIIRASLKESGWEGEVKSIRKSGEPFASWLRSFGLKDEEGLIWMLVIVQRNLTQDNGLADKGTSLADKGTHEQLVQISQNEHIAQAIRLSAVEQRARETAHELNNLATILYGYIDFMLLKEGLPSDLEEELKTIQGIGRKITLMARQLLNLGQRQEGKKTITELAPLIRETLQIVSREFSKQGIKTEFIHRQPAPLLLDPTQISQVLLNLCINAQHAMAETPKKVLCIETGQEGGFAFLKISDTGCGISKENQDKIFQPFFTTRGPTDSGERGTGYGLGLTVVKKIIEDHGGSIEVRSGVGEGTVFIIYLPLPVPDISRMETFYHTSHASYAPEIKTPSSPTSPTSPTSLSPTSLSPSSLSPSSLSPSSLSPTSQRSIAPSTSPPPSPTSPPSPPSPTSPISHTSHTSPTSRTDAPHFQGKMILVVDDEYSLRQLVKRALELRGARVDAVGAGEEGFEMIRQKKYDLVLLDLQLQDMSGERLMDLINSIPEPARPIKMVMSGRAGEMSQSLINGFDVSVVLWKPFELEDLYTKISTALGNQ